MTDNVRNNTNSLAGLEAAHNHVIRIASCLQAFGDPVPDVGFAPSNLPTFLEIGAGISLTFGFLTPHYGPQPEETPGVRDAMIACTATDRESALRLDQIETDWALVCEPAHLVLRYSQAIQRYLHSMIANRHDAEEVAQDLLLWMTEHGLPRANKDRGRFRDYLKQVVRNSARNFLRHSQAEKRHVLDLDRLADSGSVSDLDCEWIAEWRRCLIDRVWKRLRQREESSDGNLAYTILKIRVAHPEADTMVLAGRTAALASRPIRPDAFRKQLSRARQLFARLLVKEVAQTLDDPAPSDIEAELSELGLLKYVQRFLPIRRRGETPSAAKLLDNS